MLQHSGQFRRHGIEAADWNAALAVVDGSYPGRGPRHVKESLLRVERYKNVVAWRSSQSAIEIVVVRFQRGQDLFPEYFRALLALVMQNEMAGLALREGGLDVLLALRFCQEFLHCGIGSQFERTLP